MRVRIIIKVIVVLIYILSSSKMYAQEEKEIDYYSLTQNEQEILKAKETEEFIVQPSRETDETKRIKDILNYKYEGRKIYKKDIVCENKESYKGSLECIIVNLSYIVHKEHSLYPNDYYIIDKVKEIDSLNYNEAKYYYIQKITAVVEDLTTPRRLKEVYLRVFVGKTKLQDKDIFLTLRLGLLNKKEESVQNSEYYLIDALTYNAILPRRPYKFP